MDSSLDPVLKNRDPSLKLPVKEGIPKYINKIDVRNIGMFFLHHQNNKQKI
jgi:hypothetical protein